MQELKKIFDHFGIELFTNAEYKDGSVPEQGYLDVSQLDAETALFAAEHYIGQARSWLKKSREVEALIRFLVGQAVHTYVINREAQLTQGSAKEHAEADPKKEIANELNVTRQTISDYLRFYRHDEWGKDPVKLLTWIKAKRKELDKAITYSHIRNYLAKANREAPDEKVDPVQLVEDEADRIERRARKLDQDVERVVERIERVKDHGRDNERLGEKLSELRGVLAKARETAEDIQRMKASDDWEVSKTPRIESENYRQYVAGYACVSCLTDETQCAHIERRGVAMKDHDFFTWPLCPSCHTEYDADPSVAMEVWNVNPWAICSALQLAYHAGIKADRFHPRIRRTASGFHLQKQHVHRNGSK